MEIIFNWEEFIHCFYVEIERDEDIVQDERTDVRGHAKASVLVERIKSDECAVKMVEASRLNAAMVCIVWRVGDKEKDFINHKGYIPTVLSCRKYYERTFKTLERILQPDEIKILHTAEEKFKNGVTFATKEKFLDEGWDWPILTDDSLSFQF